MDGTGMIEAATASRSDVTNAAGESHHTEASEPRRTTKNTISEIRPDVGIAVGASAVVAGKESLGLPMRKVTG